MAAGYDGPVVQSGLRHSGPAGPCKPSEQCEESLGSGVRIPAGPPIYSVGECEFFVFTEIDSLKGSALL
jgi:hypothetical protein